MADLKERLRELRKQSDLSQQDIADKMGVSKQTISQYERGVREPDLDNLLALCDIFNVSADYLLGKADVTLRLLTTEELKKLSAPDQLTKEEALILSGYKALNNEGQQEMKNYSEYLLGQDRFRKDTESQEGAGTA